MIENLVKLVLDGGGNIVPLILPADISGGTGVANPSIFYDKQANSLKVNIRHVGYSLYFVENNQKYQTRWGNDYSPFCYLHPEDDCTLRTVNYLAELNPDTLQMMDFHKVNTDALDIQPVWGFIGLEDGRLVKWEDVYYLCGVRRDVKPNGEGRMELSKLDGFNEIGRTRIEPPNDPESYCEKNWMPILDMPYHFIKWSNPTEVVKVNPDTGASETVYLSDSVIKPQRDLRGGSQIISYKDYYIAVTHEVDLWKTHHGKKNGKYYHRFLVWDKNFNLVKYSKEFNFMSGGVEFCCGLTFYNNQFLISFSFHDNCSFVLSVPVSFIDNFLEL